MRLRVFPVSCLTATILLGLAAPSIAQCEPDGDIQFVCGPVSPEDLALVPDSPWVIVSSWEDDGYLSAADSRDHSTARLFPTETAEARHDSATYPACPGMTTNGFRAHGISLRPGGNGAHTLYVVRHGERESVEVFEVDAQGATPVLTWIGCAVAPEGLGLNAVVALPDGGFAATSPRTSDIWEWHTGAGWTKVPGSEDIGPNGLEISADGRWFLVAGYASQSVIRLSRGQTPIQKNAIEVGFNIDNVHWAPDGALLAAGHNAPTRTRVGECIQRRTCEGITSHVARVDQQALTSEEIFTYPTNDNLILGTVAIVVGDELWVGGVAGGTRIARVPLP
jgi:sugar lactone lactonase YvrE